MGVQEVGLERLLPGLNNRPHQGGQPLVDALFVLLHEDVFGFDMSDMSFDMEEPRTRARLAFQEPQQLPGELGLLDDQQLARRR